MVQIEHERNPEVLRQVALLLDREVRSLYQRLEKMMLENARLKGEDPDKLQLELELLRELVAQREKRLFGRSSEKRSQGPCSVLPEAEKTPRNGHGPTEQPELPIIEQIHELPEAEQKCEVCGGELCEMGEQSEDSEEISVVQRSFVLVKHRRRKYRCRCNGNVVTAPAPAKLIPGGRYSPEFAVEVAVGKYLDHLPLQRQTRIMERQGLKVSTQSLWDQIEALARHLEPSYQALGENVLQYPVLHADETHWHLMDKGSSRWWVWCVSAEDTVFYRLLGSRSTKAARSVLAGYRGVVLSDGYGAYTALARGDPGFALAHCWAHVRRKFIEAEPHYPQPCSEVLNWIGELFAIEREAPRLPFDEPPQWGELRAKLRQERSRPVIDQIYAWALEQRALPRSSLGKAIGYMLRLWPGLIRFLDDPRIPLDNNAAERALRGVVLGRKNHYGSRSRRGTEVAALFYSLCESAKLANVEPKSYLLAATRAAIANPGTVTLPRNLHD